MWESLACSFGGQCLIAVIITLNGRSGAVYHIGFPILNRSAFGIFGAWWPTFNRAVMAIVRSPKSHPSFIALTSVLGVERCQRRARRAMHLCDAACDISQHCKHQEYHGNRICADQCWHGGLRSLLARHLLFLGDSRPQDEEPRLCQAGGVCHFSFGNARVDCKKSRRPRSGRTSGLDCSRK